MLTQDAFDFGGAHPNTADLEHVIGPAIEPVIALTVLVKLVTGGNPTALYRLFGFFVAVPISRASCIGIDPQSADITSCDRLTVVVEDLRFITRNDASARAVSYPAR